MDGLNALRQALHDRDDAVVTRTVDVLLGLGRRGVDVLWMEFASLDWQVRYHCIERLCRHSDASHIHNLCSLLDENAGLREPARDALIRIGSPAIQAVCRAMGGKHSTHEGMVVLVNIGVEVVPELIHMLESSNETTQGHAAFVLLNLAQSRPHASIRQALPALKRRTALFSGVTGWRKQELRECIAAIERYC